MWKGRALIHAPKLQNILIKIDRGMVSWFFSNNRSGGPCKMYIPIYQSEWRNGFIHCTHNTTEWKKNPFPLPRHHFYFCFPFLSIMNNIKNWPEQQAIPKLNAHVRHTLTVCVCMRQAEQYTKDIWNMATLASDEIRFMIVTTILLLNFSHDPYK